MTVCPFRVVDEINQGMDQANERRVFTQLTEAACEPGTPQCFLLTPKLLPQLGFTPQCTVLQILNGPTLAGVPGADFSTARARQRDNPVRAKAAVEFQLRRAANSQGPTLAGVPGTDFSTARAHLAKSLSGLGGAVVL